MKSLYLTVSAMALLLAVAPVAHAADGSSYSATTKVEQDKDGDYKKKMTEESTDAAGTKETTKAEEKVDVGSSGTKTSVSSKSTVDPEGMNNKSVTEMKKTTKVDDDGDAESKTMSDTNTNGGTHDKVDSKTTVKAHSDGSKTIKKTKKSVHDPKGLFNKKTDTVTDTTKVDANGQTEVNHEEKVNGSKVEDTKETH